MDLFNWKDILIIFVAFLGAIASSKKIPDLNTDNRWINFAKEIMTTVSIAIFCTLANTNIEVSQEVAYIKSIFQFSMPFFAYVLIIGIGVMFIINSAIQSLLIKINGNGKIIFFIVPLVTIFELSILTHLLYIS